MATTSTSHYLHKDIDENSDVGIHTPVTHEKFVHVVVLSHGIDSLGTKNDMKFVEDMLEKQDFFDLIIHSAGNVGRTLDGLENCGRRLYEEIMQALSNFPQDVKFLLSMIGHSLGGLITRSCLFLLLQDQSLKIVPVSYISLATPHLGVRRPPGVWNSILDVGARLWFRGNTMQQLLMEDYDINDPNSKPFLLKMTEPNSVYMQALSSFKHKTLVSICKGDFQVPYCSSSITSHNPYPRTTKHAKSKILGVCGFDERYSFNGPLKCDDTQRDHINPLSHLSENYNTSDLTKRYEMHTESNRELEYIPQMLQNMNTINWRRMDLSFNHLFPHDLLVKKATLPLMDTEEGTLIVETLVNLVMLDHKLLK